MHVFSRIEHDSFQMVSLPWKSKPRNLIQCKTMGVKSVHFDLNWKFSWVCFEYVLEARIIA